jgi:ribosomal protein S21
VGHARSWRASALRRLKRALPPLAIDRHRRQRRLALRHSALLRAEPQNARRRHARIEGRIDERIAEPTLIGERIAEPNRIGERIAEPNRIDEQIVGPSLIDERIVEPSRPEEEMRIDEPIRIEDAIQIEGGMQQEAGTRGQKRLLLVPRVKERMRGLLREEASRSFRPL